jgi:hypothetical protein
MEKPSLKDLLEIRKKLKEKKLPKVFSGSIREAGIGEVVFHERGHDYEIDWQLCDGEKKTAKFSHLNLDPSKEQDRLDLGWLMAGLLDKEADRILQLIPGPNEAMQESEYYRKMSSTWRHWAQVEAGFMIFE